MQSRVALEGSPGSSVELTIEGERRPVERATTRLAIANTASQVLESLWFLSDWS